MAEVGGGARRAVLGHYEMVCMATYNKATTSTPGNTFPCLLLLWLLLLLLLSGLLL